MHHVDEAFSTEPIRNNGVKGSPLSFYHVQNITVNVSKPFVDYLRHEPLVLEVFGHLQQKLSKDKAGNSPNGAVNNSRLPPKRMLPPLLPVSQPLRSTKFGTLPPSPTSHVTSTCSTFFITIVFEIVSRSLNSQTSWNGVGEPSKS